MFNNEEVHVINESKREIKGQINARSLLWNGLTRNVVIAGGFFTSVMQNKPFKDIDIFILNNDVDVYNNLTEGYHSAVNAKHFNMTAQGWIRSQMMSYMHNTNIVDVINNNHTKAQYILTKYKTREELLDSFDYKHCKVSYVPVENKLYITRETFDCINNKVLKWNNKQHNNPNQKYRYSKFLNQGWVLHRNTKRRNYLDEILDAVSNPTK